MLRRGGGRGAASRAHAHYRAALRPRADPNKRRGAGSRTPHPSSEAAAGGSMADQLVRTADGVYLLSRCGAPLDPAGDSGWSDGAEEVAVLLDVSGSMRHVDADVLRGSLARLLVFAAKRGMRITLITYSHDVTLLDLAKREVSFRHSLTASTGPIN